MKRNVLRPRLVKGILLSFLLLITVMGINVKLFAMLPPDPSPLTTAGTNEVCAGYPFTIDVTVANFHNVANIALKLIFDDAQVEYQSATINSALNVLHPVYGATGNKFRLTTWGDAGINLSDNDILFTVTFLAKPTASGTTNFTWSTAPGDCEYAQPAPATPYPTTPIENYFFPGSCNIKAFTKPHINGPQNICGNVKGVVYSTTTGQLNYIWTIPEAAEITAGGTSSDPSVTLNWKYAGKQTIGLSYTSPTGCSDSTEITVLVDQCAENTVPTLGQWGLIIFGLALVGFGSIYILKGRGLFV
jgi:hypothetical protein